MGDRWATFDCYGTLIDWEAGIAAALAGLWPDVGRRELLALYHVVEPRIQSGSAQPYREILAESVRAIAAERRLKLRPGDEAALADSLPAWRPFPEVTGELARLRDAGVRLAILSNVDPDLLDVSVRQIGVIPDERITVAEAGSYKPAPGHWERFFERTGAGRADHVHVAASLYHDIAPCAALGIPAIWINRLGEASDLPRAAELRSLSGLAAAVARLA